MPDAMTRFSLAAGKPGVLKSRSGLFAERVAVARSGRSHL